MRAPAPAVVPALAVAPAAPPVVPTPIAPKAWGAPRPTGASPDSAVAPTPPRKGQGAVSASLSADAGAMPSYAAGVRGAVGLLFAWGRLELGWTQWLAQNATVDPRTASVGAPAGAGARFTFFSGSAGACVMALPGRLELDVCGAAEVGRMHASGYGVLSPKDATLLWLAARVGGTADLSLTDELGLRLDLEAVVPFNRPAWTLENIGVVDRPGPIDGRAALGGELRF